MLRWGVLWLLHSLRIAARIILALLLLLLLLLRVSYMRLLLGLVRII